MRAEVDRAEETEEGPDLLREPEAETDIGESSLTGSLATGTSGAGED